MGRARPSRGTRERQREPVSGDWRCRSPVSGAWRCRSRERRGEAVRRKAADLYDNAEVVIADEGAQTPVEHFETADDVARDRCKCNELMGGKQLVVLMDAVQTGPVGSTGVLWEAPFFMAAVAAGHVDSFALETVYRTDQPRLLELFAAMRAEDDERAWPLVQAAIAEDSPVQFTHINGL